MATTIKKEIMICSDCGEEIYTCDACGEYLNTHFGKEIICQESDTIQKHYCLDCKKEEESKTNLVNEKVNSMYDTNFDDVLKDADAIYQKHKPKKGESWKTLPVHYLRNKLNEEITEFFIEPEQNKYAECLDVINVALMLAKRLKEERGCGNICPKS